MWVEALSALFTAIPKWFLNKQENAAKEKERKDQLADAAAERTAQLIREGRVHEANWESKAIDNAGWRDDYMTIVLSVPLILCFIPGAAIYVYDGFEALEKTPVWYQASVSVMIAATFGYRKFADWRLSKLVEKEKSK